jgi:hypothetical protein
MITTRKRARLSSNWSDGRRVRSFALAAVLTTATVVGIGATSASANTVCDPGGDVCTVYPDTVQTPLGPVDVTVSSTDVVTVHLDPTFPDTLVVGVAISVPSGALALGCPTRCSRTTIATAGGLVVIDTVRVPPGPPGRLAMPNLAIISIHPPGPCRVSTTGSTVTFTPIQIPPGPPA